MTSTLGSCSVAEAIWKCKESRWEGEEDEKIVFEVFCVGLDSFQLGKWQSIERQLELRRVAIRDFFPIVKHRSDS
jgi:hypothetical protein